MEKRTWCYIQQPAKHEMAPCSCGNVKTQWSEYKDHLWCAICEKDFIPDHDGIFGQPIPINAARMLGLSFDKFNIEMEQVEVLDEFVLPVGKVSYIPCINFQKFFKIGKHEISIKFTSKNEEEQKNVFNVVKGTIYFNDGEIQLEFNEPLNQKNNNDFSVVIKFEYPKTQTFNLKLSLDENNQSLQIEENENWEKFNYYLSNQAIKYSAIES